MRVQVCALVAATLLVLLSTRTSADDAPASQPAEAPPVRIELPDGWDPADPHLDAVQRGFFAQLGCGFKLYAEAKSDYTDDVDLLVWAQLVQESARKILGKEVTNFRETELSQGGMAGRDTLEYEVTGDFKGRKYRYRMIMLEANGHYCKLACWSSPSRWEAAQSEFEELVQNLR